MGFLGMEPRGDRLGDGVLGLIWSGFLRSRSRYILHFCFFLSPLFFLHRSGSCFSVSFGRTFFIFIFWCLYISAVILHAFVLHFWSFLMFYYGFKIMYSTG